MFNVDNITFSENGRRISYSYSVHNRLKKYFNMNSPYYVKYDVDVSSTPLSIAIIPLLANVVPISWFVGFDIYIDEIDEVLYNSLKDLKEEFSKLYSGYNLKGSVIAKRLVRNAVSGENKGMLFGGGVDAHATYIRHKDESLKLITVHGSDIALGDAKRWNQVVTLNQTETIFSSNQKIFVESNPRDFYTYRVELLVNVGWWENVQHAPAMLSLVAPLSFKYGMNKLYIASSFPDAAGIVSGSTRKADEMIRWANVSITHDGFELKRQDKIDLIVEYVRKHNNSITLRVCYSELREELNCSRCEKCYRTILGIILSGDDPNKYGFSVDENIYDDIFHRFQKDGADKGRQYFWRELEEKARHSDDFFVFKYREKEKNFIKLLANGAITKLQSRHEKRREIESKIKFVLRNRFPMMYNVFQQLRHRKRMW